MPEFTRRSTVVALAIGLFLSACGGLPPEPRGGAEAGAQPDEETARNVAIYAAVVRQLVTKDHTFGQAKSPFERVFVVDGVVKGAGDPMVARWEVVSSFPAEVQEGIQGNLRDLPPLEFVGNPETVIVGNDCPKVKQDGVLISLGRIKGDGQRVEVPSGLFFACLGGQWLTYVLQRSGGEWKVTGTTGPVAIS